jgi:hypothetical protein
MGYLKVTRTRIGGSIRRSYEKGELMVRCLQQAETENSLRISGLSMKCSKQHCLRFNVRLKKAVNSG